MTPDRFCETLEIPRSQLNQWLRPRGIFHGVPREVGVYSAADVAVAFVFLELQQLLGTRSDMAAQYTVELAPRLRAMVASQTLPSTLKVQIGTGPVTVTVDLTAVVENLPALV